MIIKNADSYLFFVIFANLVKFFILVFYFIFNNVVIS